MKIEDAVQKATDAADKAPADLREATYTTVLRHLLQTEGQVGSTATSTKMPPVGETDSESPLPNWAVRVIEGAPDAGVISEQGDRAQQTMWAILQLYGEGVPVTTEEIRRVIQRILGIAPQNAENTARTIRESLAPQFVMRIDREDGRGYVYEPTARSLEAFEGLTT